jgi:hypothetical protein
MNRAIGGGPRFGGIINSVGGSDVNGACKATCHQKKVGAKSLKLSACCVVSPMKLLQKPEGNAKWRRNIVSAVSSSQARQEAQPRTQNDPYLQDLHQQKEKSWSQPEGEKSRKQRMILKQKKEH